MVKAWAAVEKPQANNIAERNKDRRLSQFVRSKTNLSRPKSLNSIPLMCNASSEPGLFLPTGSYASEMDGCGVVTKSSLYHRK